MSKYDEDMDWVRERQREWGMDYNEETGKGSYEPICTWCKNEYQCRKARKDTQYCENFSREDE